MKTSLIFALAFAQAVFGAANVAKRAGSCAADNCARAVTGTRKGTAGLVTATSDCRSFVAQTVASLQVVPTYATACSGTVRYSSACSCLGITSASATTPTGTPTPPTGTYNPTLPTTYAGCAVDPATASPFELLDAGTALPIVNNNGIASLATEVNDNLPLFHFSKPSNAPAGVYDLVLADGAKTLYYAVFASGKVGFTSTSSNGQAFVPGDGGDKYVTSVFTVECNGHVTAGIIGGAKFTFSVVNNNVIVSNVPSPKMRRDIPVPEGFYVLPPPSPPSGTTDRCPNPSQMAVPKSPPTPPSANGCGTATGIGSFVPELDFHECCNGHDYCYGDCSQTFNGCNSAFLQCNINQCDRDFPNRGLKHWSCNKAAHLYGNAVTGSIGMGAFASATKESCDCKCSDPNLKACGDKCVDTKTDPNNCGDCNFFCPSGACTNGACSFNSCKGQSCSSFGPCGPGGSCVCASITDGTGFCVNGNTPCAGLPSCGSSADCGLGSVCAVGTCCGGNVCITTDQCGGKQAPPRLMMDKRVWINGTIASQGVWLP